MASFVAEIDTLHDGRVRDAQLDPLGQCLATASEDGTVRLWDVRVPSKPSFLALLDGHEDSVCQVAWADPAVGVLLASASADGAAVIWGRGSTAEDWKVAWREDLSKHGQVLGVSWAPPEHGAVLACASGDGSVTVVHHAGSVRSSAGCVEQRWECRTFKAQVGRVASVSWASAPVAADKVIGMGGARIATVGGSGLQVWRYCEGREAWEKEVVSEESLLLGSASDATGPSPDALRDVAWKAWDGIGDVLACASGDGVDIWRLSGAGDAGAQQPKWRREQRVELGEPVWKVSWAEIGDIMIASFGMKAQRSALLKQRLDGEWDAVDVADDGEAAAGANHLALAH